MLVTVSLQGNNVSRNGSLLKKYQLHSHKMRTFLKAGQNKNSPEGMKNADKAKTQEKIEFFF